MMRIRGRALAGLAVAIALAACGGDKGAAGTSTGATTAAPSGEAGAVVPGPGGQIINVEMLTDPADGSNKFVPNDIAAKKGDVIRFTLKTGVHNVHFLPDSNPGAAKLPPASQMLQAPGQTHDMLVDFAGGRYYFQCDPHAALGMTGHLTVQ